MEFSSSSNPHTMEIKITWSTYDVLVKAHEMGIELTETRANVILLKMERYHDASIGINWDVIASYILDENY